MNFNKKNIFILSLSALVIGIGLLLFFMLNQEEKVFTTYSDFLGKVDSGHVRLVVLDESSEMVFHLHNSEGTYITNNPRNPQLKESLLLMGVEVVEEGTGAFSFISTALPLVAVAGMFFIVFRNMKKGEGKKAMALNVSAVADGEKVVNFKDVAGNVEAKDMVMDVVDFIKNPKKYEKYGARMPRGLMFYGPPGTGKTLMAKAIAGEAGVDFFSVSGSDFVQMFVGVGASRVRELFKKAREAKKAVIFIDEIDAVGKARGGTMAGGNDEREQTLNALLTEMSGFSSAEGIVVIAATNRLDTLDEALLRPGRFDRQIEIALPDVAGRGHILKSHAKNKPLEGDVDLQALARQTVFFSGAMLENLLNEAAINAAKLNKTAISNEDIDKAYYTVIAGSEKKDRSSIKERERQITAYHEGGHALAIKLLSPENSVAKITIIPSTKGAGGFCLNVPPDKMYYTKAELENQAIALLAGRAAEELVFGKENITTGASSDIERANAIIKDYVTKYGMSDELGMSNAAGDKAEKECQNIMKNLYSKALDVLTQNKTTLNKIAQALLEKETLSEEQLDALLQ